MSHSTQMSNKFYANVSTEIYKSILSAFIFPLMVLLYIFTNSSPNLTKGNLEMASDFWDDFANLDFACLKCKLVQKKSH